MDSNHDKVIQSHLCYHYTTRQETRQSAEKFSTSKRAEVNAGDELGVGGYGLGVGNWLLGANRVACRRRQKEWQSGTGVSPVTLGSEKTGGTPVPLCRHLRGRYPDNENSLCSRSTQRTVVLCPQREQS